jgi:hypothetical protein
MTHPYSQHKEVKPGHKRAKEMVRHFKSGGAVKRATGGATALKRGGHAKHEEVKAEGKASGGRLDKYARGGATKKHGKGHHTHINIVVAPKGGDAAPPPGLGAGGPPMGGPGAPMVPKAPMGPPPGALGAGPPGMPPGMPPPGAGGPKPPGMMRRGGKVYSGISSKANIEHWAKRAGENTRYERGGKVHMDAGAGTGEGRLEKKKAYGAKAKGG